MKGDIGELTGMLRVQGVARGSGTAPRMQCVADGEEALEQALRDAFPFAVFTNDFMHASGYMNACCQALGIENAQKEYKTCRAIMLRHGAGSAVDRIRSASRPACTGVTRTPHASAPSSRNTGSRYDFAPGTKLKALGTMHKTHHFSTNLNPTP